MAVYLDFIWKEGILIGYIIVLTTRNTIRKLTFFVYIFLLIQNQHGYMCYCDLDMGRGGQRHIASASNSRSPGFKILPGNWVS
jgi:hypothetical protein